MVNFDNWHFVQCHKPFWHDATLWYIRKLLRDKYFPNVLLQFLPVWPGLQLQFCVLLQSLVFSQILFPHILSPIF